MQKESWDEERMAIAQIAAAVETISHAEDA